MVYKCYLKQFPLKKTHTHAQPAIYVKCLTANNYITLLKQPSSSLQIYFQL